MPCYPLSRMNPPIFWYLQKFSTFAGVESVRVVRGSVYVICVAADSLRDHLIAERLQMLGIHDFRILTQTQLPTIDLDVMNAKRHAFPTMTNASTAPASESNAHKPHASSDELETLQAEIRRLRVQVNELSAQNEFTDHDDLMADGRELFKKRYGVRIEPKSLANPELQIRIYVREKNTWKTTGVLPTRQLGELQKLIGRVQKQVKKCSKKKDGVRVFKKRKAVNE